MKFSKFISNFDYILFFSALILSIIGIFFIYSANLRKADELHYEYVKQILFFIISLIILIIILFLSERNIQSFSFIFYFICILGLIITLFFPEIKGQRRLSIQGISIQFSDFIKIASMLVLSKYYENKSKEEIKNLLVYLKGSIIFIIPMLLILLQPDFGTVLVFIPIFLGISYIAGVKKRYLIYSILIIFFIAFIPAITTINKLFFNNENATLSLFTNTKYVIILYTTLSVTLFISIIAYFNIIKGINENFKTFFYWYVFFSSIMIIGLTISYPADKFLKPYQKDRLMIFFDPNVDPKGKGYNILQSQTTIGNGGIFGKGWCKGEQIQNFFLPEQATDFIYPVIAEESGFLGSLLILFLFSLIFYRGLFIVINAKYAWESYLVIGILSMLLFHILQNVGMCVGIMPITGIPLPFLSYGGSFLCTCFICIGIMMNIELNRYQYT